MTDFLRESPSGPLQYRLTRLTSVAIPEVDTALGTDITVTVPGAEVGDVVAWSPRSALSEGMMYGRGRVSAPDTVQLRVCNALNTIAASVTTDVDVAIFKPGKNRLSPSGPDSIVLKTVTGVVFDTSAFLPETEGGVTLSVPEAEVGDVVVWDAPNSGSLMIATGPARVPSNGQVRINAYNVRTDDTQTAAEYTVVMAIIKPRANRRPPSGPKVMEATTTDAGVSMTAAANNFTSGASEQLSALISEYGSSGVLLWSPSDVNYNTRLWYGSGSIAGTASNRRYRLYNVGAALSVSTAKPSTVLIAQP